MDDKDSLKHF